MKLIKSFLWMLVMLPAFLLNSCEKQPEVEQEGTLELGIFIDQLEGNLKSALTDSNDVRTHFVVVSIANESGELVLDNERLELYNFSGHWITKEIRLKTGIYKLVKFFVIDAEGNVRLAAPLSGSPKAYLVNHPLPLPFEIMTDQVTRVVPEVLLVIEDPPEEFGYVTFSYTVVKALDFFIAVYIDDPMRMTPIAWTDAKLTVIIDSLWKHAFKLEPRINRVTVRDGSRLYLLVIEKEGFMPVKLEISRDELLKSSPESPLLVGLPAGEFHLLVLQPGPDNGKDAMISDTLPDDNFGDWPYFQATGVWPYITCDMQHQTTRSLVEWDLNQLPKSATIKKAILTLYYPYYVILDTLVRTDPATGVVYTVNDTVVPYPEKHGAVLQRILTPWEEHEVTWNNQPKTTTENQAHIPLVYYFNYAEHADCVNCFVPPVSEVVDVTDLILDMAKAGNYGMLMKLVQEQNSPEFIFASSDFESPKLWPKLEIYYTLPE